MRVVASADVFRCMDKTPIKLKNIDFWDAYTIDKHHRILLNMKDGTQIVAGDGSKAVIDRFVFNLISSNIPGNFDERYFTP